MDENEPFVDYYKVLQCDRSATIEALKKSYQQLVLASHPDKIGSMQNEEDFITIQKAWSVLRDPESRKQYDALLSCHEHSELLLYDTIFKCNMVFDSSESVFTYPCRCGGTYVLDESESPKSSIVIGCDECSFSILVKEK